MKIVVIPLDVNEQRPLKFDGGPSYLMDHFRQQRFLIRLHVGVSELAFDGLSREEEFVIRYLGSEGDLAQQVYHRVQAVGVRRCRIDHGVP